MGKWETRSVFQGVRFARRLFHNRLLDNNRQSLAPLGTKNKKNTNKKGAIAGALFVDEGGLMVN